MLTITYYIRDTRSRPRIIDAVYLHIPMYSPVDRATIGHANYRYKPQTRCTYTSEMILYRSAIDFISILC